MQTFILISVTLFASTAFVDEMLNWLSIRLYPGIVSKIIFYISTALGIIYISKILWILLVLDFVHGNNIEAWNKYKYYRAFDHIVCISGFIYQLYIVYLNVIL